jgi:hypothetical protein
MIYRSRRRRSVLSLWYAWPAETLSAFPLPEKTEAAPVPGDHGVRPDDVNGHALATPRLREPDPQHSVGGRDAKTRTSRSIHDTQLVSERDDLQMQRRA